jgi:hypothetical protein
VLACGGKPSSAETTELVWLRFLVEEIAVDKDLLRPRYSSETPCADHFQIKLSKINGTKSDAKVMSVENLLSL